MSAAPPTDHLQALRRALASSDHLRIGEILAPLSAETRAALRREAMAEISKGIKEGLEGLQNAWRTPSFGHVVVDDAFRRRLNAPEEKLRAYRLAAVGLGLKKDVESALFSARMNSFSMGGWQDEPERTLSYQAGLLLVARDEPWREDVLYRLLDGELRTGLANDGALELSLRLLREGRGPQERVLAAAARQARRLGFRLWAKDRPGFPWHTQVGRRVLWAALEARDEPFLASIDYEASGSPLIRKVLDLSAAGDFSRSEVITLTLRRLAESSRALEAGWWVRLLEAMDLSEAEWLEHAESVLDLIGAPNPRAVAVGLAAAGKLVRNRRLDPAELVPVLSLAVAAPVAGSAKTAVGLLRKCAEQDEAVRLEAFTGALAGLQHPKPAVHDVVLQWLEADPWWREDLEALSAAADAALMAPAAAAARLDALMPADPAASAETFGPESEPISADADLRAELDRLICSAATPERRAWMEKLQSALEGEALPPWSPPLHLRWSDGQAFSLPSSVAETAQILLRVTVSRLTPRDWERIAHGVRLPITEAERQMLPRLLDPVLKLRTALEDDNPSARMADWGCSFGAIRVAEAWSGLPATDPNADNYLLNPHLSQGRVAQLRSILGAIKRGERQAPLGTPTHDSGWLDPRIFAERLLARSDLPEEELWELSAALYRLAPDPELRAEAWNRLGPALSRWGKVPALMLSAALAPGEEGERGQVTLVNWLRGQPHEKLRSFQDQAEDALAAVQSLFGIKRQPKPVEERSVNYHSLRLVTSALRCRHGLGEAVALELVRDRLPGVYRRLLDPKVKPPNDSHGWMLNTAWSQWAGLADLLPEMTPTAPSPWQMAPDYAFYFPPVGVELAKTILAQDEFQSWGAMPSMAVELLRQPYSPVAPFLPRLIRCLSVNAEQAATIVQLWAEALRDGRLRMTALVDALVPALTDKACKPRAVLGALELLVRQYAPARHAAVCAGERVVAASVESLNPNDRVRVLETLLQWHSGAGTVPQAAARAALEGLAAKGKNNRAGTLARQLLDLSPRSRRSAEAACREHDIQAMLAGLPQ